jgi:long-chain acyl-CoA synthetase
LGVPVVPVRLTGLDRVLHRNARFATPGRASVRFAVPIHAQDDDPAVITKTIENAVRALDQVLAD